MAEDQKPDRPESESAAAEPPVSHPHDKYFYSVFSDTRNAVDLLRPYLPQEVARTLRWSSLTHVPGRFVSDDWRSREADLLFSVERQDSGSPVLVYVLLEHQSTPDRWMRLRLLNYYLMAWMWWRREHKNEPQLPLIVPVVFYQGAEPWRYDRQFAELVAGAEPDWGWVPRFEHLLIDQTQQNPETVAGAVGTRLAQLTMMATFRDTWEEVLEEASRLMREMYHVDGFDAVALHVEYVLAAQPEERHPAFGAALRRNVPGRGGELMNYVERMVEQGRREGMVNVERMVEQGRQEGRQEGIQEGRQEGIQEGRQEGELMGRLQAAQGLLGHDVPWSTIEAATGIDEAAFRRLKQQFDDNGAGAE